MKNRRSDFSLGTAVSLRKASQIFFHILILNTIYLLAFSTVKNEFSGDRAVAVLGLGAFLLVDQMAILLRNSFLAVLDLENPAGACLRVKHHHVEFAHGELWKLFSESPCRKQYSLFVSPLALHF